MGIRCLRISQSSEIRGASKSMLLCPASSKPCVSMRKIRRPSNLPAWTCIFEVPAMDSARCKPERRRLLGRLTEMYGVTHSDHLKHRFDLVFEYAMDHDVQNMPVKLIDLFKQRTRHWCPWCTESS